MVVDRPLSEPVKRIELPYRVYVTEFSPFEWSANLLALGLADSVLIGQIKLPEEEEIQVPEFEKLREIHQDTRVQAMAWGPRTSLLVAPKCLQFATTGTDYKVRLYSQDAAEVTVQPLKGHTDYVNSLVYEPEQGDLLASCSDDHTARMWNCTTGKTLHTFHLSSPGMAVCWHPSETGKLLVAQKSGVISLYNSSSYAPILSLDACSTPLLAADWCRPNPLMVAVVAFSDIIYFDLSRPSLPSERKTVHGDGARAVKFSRSTDSLVATIGKPGGTLKVIQHRAALTLVSNQKQVIGGGCSWHLRLPYLAVGNDRHVDIYKFSV